MSRTQAASSHRRGPSVPEVRAKTAVDLLIYLLLLVAVCLVYGQVRHYPLVDFDDLVYVTHNRHVASGVTLEGVVWAFTRSYEGYWSPLTWLSYMADVQFFGPGGGPHHVTNVLIHAASACLLFAFLKRATRARWQSACVAALFAIHPLHVESVAWVAERKDVLCGFFWFLTCWAYLRYVERPAAATYAAVVVSFACGLMSKPMIVTLPLVLLLLDLWPLGRLSIVRHAERAGRQAPRLEARQVSLVGMLGEKAPLVALSIAVSAVTIVAQRNAGGVASLDVISLVTRVENSLVSYAVYLVKMIWPS
ncbi:MAG: glycosyltransferase family 39 protein, partial [Planctomycetes bacterium]|nr:glycosyltransferase family 39 protein [Planctomycetota bacterium]